MNYTLDSVHQFVEALKHEFPEFRTFTVTPVLQGFGDATCEQIENTYYFGVYTTCNNPDIYTQLRLHGGGYINLEPNSQIILGFQNSFIKISGTYADKTTIKHQFRGFEIKCSY